MFNNYTNTYRRLIFNQIWTWNQMGAILSVFGSAALTPTSEWAFAHRRSGWCARRTQIIYTGLGRRMPYIQWGGESCIALHRGTYSRGLQAGERGRSSQVSRCVSVESLLVMSQIAYGFPSFPCLEWSLLSPFIDARGTQGYVHVLRDVFLRKEDLKSSILSCSWWRTTVGGVAPVLWCCSDVPWHMWPCGRCSYDA
jgi:hypothetical protein